MAELANIVVNNGSSDITFTPTIKDGLNVILSASANSVALAPRLQILGNTLKAGSNRKMTLRHVLPYEASDLNGNKSVKNIISKIEFSIPQDASVTYISQLRNMLSHFLENAIVLDAIDNGNLPY